MFFFLLKLLQLYYRVWQWQGKKGGTVVHLSCSKASLATFYNPSENNIDMTSNRNTSVQGY